MRVMKNKATLLSLAIAGLFAASAAHATADLTLATPTTSAKFASEIVPAKLPAAGLTNAGTAVATAAGLFDVKVKLGFGLSANQQKYVRFDLSSGTWGTALTGANMQDGTTAANIAGITLASGGAATDNYVIYQITAANTATGTPLGDVLFFAPPTFLPTSTAASVNVTYTLHDTAVSALAGPTSTIARLVTTTGPFVNFASGNKFAFGSPQTEFVAATSSFKNFCGNGTQPGTAGCAAGSDVDAIVATVTSYTFDGTVADATGTALAALTTINGATSKFTITGSDWSSAVSAYVDNTNGCNSGATLASASTATTVATGLTATSAAITLGTTALAPPVGGYAVCFKANGTSPIAAQSFTGTFNPVAASTTYAPLASSSVATGTFQRDGVELQAPWFTLGGTGSAYISRFFLTNTGSTDSLCTVTFLSETGNTVSVNSTPNAQGNSGAGVTVPAGKQVAVLATDLVTAFSGNARAAVRFSCPSPSANIQGRYIVTHSSGAVDSGTLLRPGTN